MRRFACFAAAVGIVIAARAALAAPAIFVNQIAYDARGPKIAVIQVDAPLPGTATASLIDDAATVQATTSLGPAEAIREWAPGKTFYRADFSGFDRPGTYRIR